MPVLSGYGYACYKCRITLFLACVFFDIVTFSPVNTQIFGRDLLDRMNEGFTGLGFKHGMFSTTKKDTLISAFSL